jgi:xanthine dehydrogenase accessory factor
VNAREFYERALQLERGREPFALATVVGRREPISSHLGDRAIVLADGTMEGFVGGACSRHIVVHYALEAMRTGQGRLLKIGTDDEMPLHCASEGAVDVYVEPHLPRVLLLVAGQTPVAHELALIGKSMERFRVVHTTSEQEFREVARALTDGERTTMVAVVATQGVFDEAALEALLAGPMPAYVGLLASRKRAAAVFRALQQQGVDAQRLRAVSSPAGLDIGARIPSEVAVSILAEIVSTLSVAQSSRHA